MLGLGLVKGDELAFSTLSYELAVKVVMAKFSEIESMLEYWASASLSWSAPPARSSKTKHHLVFHTVAPLELHFGLFQPYRSGRIFSSPGSDSIKGSFVCFGFGRVDRKAKNFRTCIE